MTSETLLNFGSPRMRCVYHLTFLKNRIYQNNYLGIGVIEILSSFISYISIYLRSLGLGREVLGFPALRYLSSYLGSPKSGGKGFIFGTPAIIRRFAGQNEIATTADLRLFVSVPRLLPVRFQSAGPSKTRVLAAS